LRFGVALCKRPGLYYEWPLEHGWIAFNKTPTAAEKPKMCVKCVAAKKQSEQEVA
jgi:hypothetical protein